jgi:hypothetical protein
MQRNRIHPWRLPKALAPLIGALAIGLASAPAGAEEVGRFCTKATCSGATSQPWTAALGFGAAVWSTAWLARRRADLDT